MFSQFFWGYSFENGRLGLFICKCGQILIMLFYFLSTCRLGAMADRSLSDVSVPEQDTEELCAGIEAMCHPADTSAESMAAVSLQVVTGPVNVAIPSPPILPVEGREATISPDLPLAASSPRRGDDMAGGELTNEALDQLLDQSNADTIKSSQQGKRQRKSKCPLDGCPVVTQHMKRHFISSHLPPFLQESQRSRGVSGSELRDFLASLAKKLRLDGVRALLDHVKRHSLHPQYAASIPVDDRKLAKALNSHLHEPARDLSVNPPNSAGALLHWQVLGCVLNSLNSTKQGQVRRYRPATTRHPSPRRQRTDRGHSSVSSGRYSSDHSRHGSHEDRRRDRRSPPRSERKTPSSRFEDRQAEYRRPREERRQHPEGYPRRRSPLTPHGPSKVASSMEATAMHTPPRRDDGPPRGFDSHFHADRLLAMSNTRSFEEALAKLPKSSVEFDLLGGVCVFCDPETMPVRSADRRHLMAHRNIYFAYGLHPKKIKEAGAHAVDQWAFFEDLDTLLKSNRAVALGEVGLDYSVSTPTPEDQQKALQLILPLAFKNQVPVILHCRDKDKNGSQAARDCLAIMRSALAPSHTVVRHSFNGSLEEMRQWQAAFPNTYFGFSGLSTGARAHRDFPGVVMALSLDRILLETDSPHLVPTSVKASVNSPMLLPEVAKEVSKYTLQRLSVTDVLNITHSNAMRCFGLSH